MSVTIDLMNASGETDVPSKADFKRWSRAVLAGVDRQTEDFSIGIRLIDEKESAELNQNFRRKSGPTNVLSFTYPDLPATEERLLGDLAICTQVVGSEAEQQDKSKEAHWAHMTVHGILHLLGYDHQTKNQTSTMENLECLILEKLGYANPYQ